MKVNCPQCGHSFYVQTRAPLGEGSQKGKTLKKINPNKKAILQILQEQPRLKFTVRQVQGSLYGMKIKRWKRGDREQPSGEWNYHHVQVDLSLLVGKGLIKMNQDSEEYWDNKDQAYETRRVPKYWVDPVQEGFLIP